MKTEKDNLSIFSAENFKEELTESITIITKKYAQVISEYYSFVREKLRMKNRSVLHFIIVRGLETITTVFKTILFKTKNLDLAYYHSQKAYYFYVEFVGQISEDEKMYLQLTSRDACIYVYKKTIFHLTKSSFTCHINNQSDNFYNLKNKIDLVNIYINIFKNYLLKYIEYDNQHEDDEQIELLHFKIFIDKYFNSNKYLENSVGILDKIVEATINMFHDIHYFFKINEELVKLLSKKNMKYKIKTNYVTEDFHEKLKLCTPSKFALYLLE